MKALFVRLATFSVIASFVTLAMQVPVSAHVTVKPGEALTATYQTFTVSVPNEKSIPTTSIKVVIPADVTSVTPTQKQGWSIAAEKSGEGEKELVTSITWSRGQIGEGLRNEFSFSAKVPSTATELQWKAYQTYADGVVVAWDSSKESDHGSSNSGPFSVTKVVAKTAQQTSAEAAEKVAADAQATATFALYLGAASLLVSLVAVYFITKK